MAVAAPAKAKTIVVADATAFVRDRFTTALKTAGHKATATSTSAELVAHLQLAGARVDMVVLDLRLPPGRRARPIDRKSTRLNSSHVSESRMPSSA